MKNYKKLIAGSLFLAAIIMASPIATFAKEKDKQNNNKIEVKEEKTNKLNWFGSNWFKNKSSKSEITIPVISNLTVTSHKLNKATIKWNTDVRSNSFVWFSTTPKVDTTKIPNIKRNDRVLNHKFEIKKLQPNTLYYVIVGSANKEGIIKSSEISFTTSNTPKEIKAPVISDIKSTVNDSNVTITWNTNKPSTSSIFYSKNTPVDTSVATTLSVVENELVTKHTLSIPNLSSSTIYHFILKSADDSKNVVVSDEHSFKTN